MSGRGRLRLVGVAAVCVATVSCILWGVSDDPLAGSLTLEGLHNQIAVTGDTCYLRRDDLVTVVDVSRASRPVVVDAFMVSDEDGPFVAAGTILLAGGMLYDTTAPHSPTQVARVLPVSLPIASAVLSLPFVYAISDNILHILDIGDPASPTELSTMTVTGTSLWMDGPFLYVEAEGTLVLDMTDPADPVTIRHGIPQEPLPRRLTRDNIGYEPGADMVLFEIWDVSDAEAPVMNRSIVLPELIRGAPLALVNDTLLVLSQAFMMPALQQLWAVDVSEPSRPGVPRRLDAGNMAFGTACVSGDRVFTLGAVSFIGAGSMLCIFDLP